jgi:hypothetical protein
MNRICRICSVEKLITEFSKHKTYKDGIDTSCKECVRERKRQIWASDPERYRAYGKKYKAANKEIIAERAKKYVAENRDARVATMKAYRQNTKYVQAEYVRRRQAAKMQRTPAWLTEDDIWMMREAYKLARLRTKLFGFSWHVDHVLPLQGKVVSGLHVPTNLQVIPWLDNLKKHNRVNP